MTREVIYETSLLIITGVLAFKCIPYTFVHWSSFEGLIFDKNWHRPIKRNDFFKCSVADVSKKVGGDKDEMKRWQSVHLRKEKVKRVVTGKSRSEDFSLYRSQKQEDIKRYFQVDQGKIYSQTNHSPPMGAGRLRQTWNLSLA